MSGQKYVALLNQGVDGWNTWRRENPQVLPRLFAVNLRGANLRGANLRRAGLHGAHLTGANLTEADLRAANLTGADLSEADLRGANLREAVLIGADLSGAGLHGADLSKADLSEADLLEARLTGASLIEADLSRANLANANLHKADLSKAKLGGANLGGADLSKASLRGADLSGANLIHATLVGTDLANAALTGCRIYGVSAWGLNLDGAKQQDLVIAPPGEPDITADNIEVAQFMHLLLYNQAIRAVIDTIICKAVLILGRFPAGRRKALDALRDELRNRGCLPITFDFAGPATRNRSETITLLARMARFVIADISDAKGVLQELRTLVPDLPSVPVQPIILAMQEEPGVFDLSRPIQGFLKVHRYDSQEHLLADLGERVIRPAETKVQELRGHVR
jgi:uncharacterized protein YjbI with pentapeptide repeats